MYKQRCAWVPTDKPYYMQYHDEEWGIPVYDDHKLFEMLTLEGAQAGLSWDTVLKKRAGYSAAFHKFDPQMCAAMSDAVLKDLMHHQGIIRNFFKIRSVRNNAIVYGRIQKEFGSFSTYVWAFVGGCPLVNTWRNSAQVPASTPLSEKLSKDLKQRGMTFVGPTIMYAFMQAVGLVNDHTTDCFCRQQSV